MEKCVRFTGAEQSICNHDTHLSGVHALGTAASALDQLEEGHADHCLMQQLHEDVDLSLPHLRNNEIVCRSGNRNG